MVTNNAVMSHVHVSHDEAIFANNSPITGGCAYIERAIFADNRIITNFKESSLAPIFQILRR